MRHIEVHGLLSHLTALGPFPEHLCRTKFAESCCPWNSNEGAPAEAFQWVFLVWEGCSPPLTASSVKTTSFSLLFGHPAQEKLVTIHSFEAASFIYTACSYLACWSLPALVYSTTPPTDCRVSLLPSVLLGWIPLHSSSPEQWSAQHMAPALLPGHCLTELLQSWVCLWSFVWCSPGVRGSSLAPRTKIWKKKTPHPTLRVKQLFQGSVPPAFNTIWAVIQLGWGHWQCRLSSILCLRLEQSKPFCSAWLVGIFCSDAQQNFIFVKHSWTGRRVKS